MKLIDLPEAFRNYVNDINLKEIEKGTYPPTSYNWTLQKMISVYRTTHGKVDNHSIFDGYEKEINDMNRDMAYPYIDYKALFDACL